MKIHRRWRRPSQVVIAVVLATSALLPILSSKAAHALTYGLVTSRSITMSTATISVAANYTVSFTGASGSLVKGIIVDFCSNDPIIGDSCTAPTGFTVTNLPTVSSVSIAGESGGSWAATNPTSGNVSTFELYNSSATGTMSTGSASSFTITSATNTSTLGTFYARILTFDTKADADAYTATGSDTGLIDAGGIALSTVQAINVTAKVQEQLNFCIGTTSPPTYNTGATAQTSCGSLSGSSVILGNNNGVLSTAGPYVDVTTQYIIGTNAQGGAAVVMKGATLTSGSNTIPAIGGTATASTSGTGQFGVCTYEGTGSNLVFTNETGGASGAYNYSACNTATQTSTYSTGTGGAATARFGFNTTATSSAAGDPLALENAGNNSTGILAMIGNIATTQIAGIYTTTLSFIATGTY